MACLVRILFVPKAKRVKIPGKDFFYRLASPVSPPLGDLVRGHFDCLAPSSTWRGNETSVTIPRENHPCGQTGMSTPPSNWPHQDESHRPGFIRVSPFASIRAIRSCGFALMPFFV